MPGDRGLVVPRVDEQLYRFVELPNSLRALLITDAAADKAAASVDVSGGRRQKPKRRPRRVAQSGRVFL